MKLILDSKTFEPIDSSQVTVYKCGITPYSTPHLGNIKSAVNFDILHRLLRIIYGKNSVKWVENITDVDDKLIAAADQSDTLDKFSAMNSIATNVVNEYNSILKQLNVLSPTIQPKVTDNIQEIITYITKIIEAGFAYESNGHVLFDREKYPDFHLNPNILPSSLKAEQIDYKRHPHDFVLWKPSEPLTIGWESPWGFGRMGWHIECSSLIQTHIGQTIDIHLGGIDLQFPHHENECAQSHAHNRKPLANYWLHNGMLDLNGKMSKSLGNMIFYNDVIQKYQPRAVRYFLLTAHYTQPLKFSWESMDSAERSVKDLHHVFLSIKDGNHIMDEHDLHPLLNDLNTPIALRTLHQLSKIIKNGQGNDLHISSFYNLYSVLGLDIDDMEMSIDDDVKQLMMDRDIARKNKDFIEADRLRNILLSSGIKINDTPLP